MNEFISIFLTWQFLVLCIGIASVTFVLRTIIEFTILDNPHLPGDRTSKFWREVVLVILPIILGMIFAVVGKSFPYPTVLTDVYSKFLFSASSGLLSPTLYRVIRALLWKNVDQNQPYQPQPYQPQPYQPQPYQPPSPGPQIPIFVPNADPNAPIAPNNPTFQDPNAPPPVVPPAIQSIINNIVSPTPNSTMPNADDPNESPGEPKI